MMPRFVVLAVFVCLCFAAFGQVPDGKVDPKAQAAIQQFQKGPSVFTENQGQWADESIRFALDGSGARGPRMAWLGGNA
jgi:hypothetical protein